LTSCDLICVNVIYEKGNYPGIQFTENSQKACYNIVI